VRIPKVKITRPRFSTLKLRVVSDGPLAIEKIEATDSTQATRSAPGVERTAQFKSKLKCSTPGGRFERTSARVQVRLLTMTIRPNTFDRTLVTVRTGGDGFVQGGRPQLSRCCCRTQVAVLPDNDGRAVALAGEQKDSGARTHNRAEMPEQTWSNAWAEIPRKI
jgi:hypothetical protein